MDQDLGPFTGGRSNSARMRRYWEWLRNEADETPMTRAGSRSVAAIMKLNASRGEADGGTEPLSVGHWRDTHRQK
jgi:hypothetical protein